MKKILIIGASGYIGNRCFKEFNYDSEYEVFGTQFTSTRNDLITLDYSKPKDFFNLLSQIEPDVILWCGGLKNLSITEKNYKLSLKQNFHSIKSVIKYQKLNKISNFIYLSSDYVFDGIKGNYNHSDLPNPTTNYGKSKLLAENYIIENSSNYSIIRAGAIIGEGSVFFDWIVKSLSENKNLELYDNYFTPTPILNLLEGIKVLAEHPMNKIFHISGRQKLSRFDFGLLIKEHFSKSKSKLIKTDYKLNPMNLQYDLSLNISEEFSDLNNIEHFLNKIFSA